ncbi:MAG: hypothetical protein LIO62_06540 [Clostridiales bacterium]|nr:hypothetical protein [Clostridiales bacterium]
MKKFKKVVAVILAIIIVIVGSFGIYILYRFNCNKGDSYESMTESQINWLNDGIYERSVTASVFFHMPTPAFQEAYDNGAEYAGFDMYNTIPYDDIEGNSLFDEMTQDNEYIKLISCAHQHSNNMCSLYNGRYYQLSRVSGYSAGRADFITPSCTLVSINVNSNEATGMYYFEQITG